LDNLLLLVAQTGVLIYSAFCMIGAFFQMSQYSMAFLAALATMVQTMLQTIFILDASNRYTATGCEKFLT
jgi:membrane protein YdbS with pleckstrin-like domain